MFLIHKQEIWIPQKPWDSPVYVHVIVVSWCRLFIKYARPTQTLHECDIFRNALNVRQQVDIKRVLRYSECQSVRQPSQTH